jgi:LuxR family maltose regulon positive regulatory protein
LPKLLSTRLSPALPSGELVFRAALVERLVAASPRVILVSAPAGAGKTICLAQWAAADSRPSGWLRLDAADNDPLVLLRGIVVAARETMDLDPSLLDLLEQPPASTREAIMPALLGQIVASRPFTFVFDDVHLLSNPACLAFLAAAVESLPAEATIALGTRSTPALPLARWRAAGHLVEVGMSDLALDPMEAGEVLRGRGIELDESDLGRLMQLTEGWATGISLASLIARGRPPEAWLPHVQGDHRQIAAYLVEEVLQSQSESIQRFLLRTSILDPLCAAACRAVTGRTDAQAVLERLHGDNLFLTPLDEHGQWFRYHRLFADLLQQQLAARCADELPAVHAAAARWCEETGDVPAAVWHRLAAGEAQAAADLVSEGWFGLVSVGRFEMVRRMLDWFTREQVLAHGPLTVACGGFYMADGDPSMAAFWAQAAARACIKESDGDRWDWLRGAQAVLRAVVAESADEMLAHAEVAALEIEPPSEQWRHHAMLWLGIAQWLCGTPGAQATLEGAVRDGRMLNPAGEVMAGGVLALMAEQEGDWTKAAALVEETMSWARALSLAEHRVNGFCLAARARLLAHLSDPDEEVARDVLVGQLMQMPPGTWMGLPASTTLTELALQRGDVAEAVHWSACSDAMLALYPEAGIMRDRAEFLRKMVERQRLTTPLTPAERRVLGLLPTQLSGTEIAARLYVAPATVKTQLQSIYAKLGVNARTPAVERAREVGLLPGQTP